MRLYLSISHEALFIVFCFEQNQSHTLIKDADIEREKQVYPVQTGYHSTNHIVPN